jgi:DNA-binding winged helix-turn-helix (wHTH) protein/TolB-like protein
MGCENRTGYTRRMKPECSRVYESVGLRIDPSLGQVTNRNGESIRLGPVNMKVLAALLDRPGQVVSRNALFDGIWGNQVVGEDALTRCVSDVRAELRKISGRPDLIETLPKRGYRWAAEVRVPGPAADIPPAVADHPAAAAAPAADSESEGSGASALRARLLRLTGRGLAYLAAMLVMASLIVWSIDRFSHPAAPVVAILPVAGETGQEELAARLDLELNESLMGMSRVRVLAHAAIDSRPANPFPFFRHEFDARWVVEGELRRLSDRDVLTVSVVDARTGIVDVQFTESLDKGEADSGDIRLPVTVLESVQEFFESQR